METLEFANPVYGINLRLGQNNKPCYISVECQPNHGYFGFVGIPDATQVTMLDRNFEYNRRCIEWFADEIACAVRLKTLLPEYILNPNHGPISIKQIRRCIRSIYTGEIR